MGQDRWVAMVDKSMKHEPGPTPEEQSRSRGVATTIPCIDSASLPLIEGVGKNEHNPSMNFVKLEAGRSGDSARSLTYKVGAGGVE